MIKGSKHEDAAAIFDKLVFAKVYENEKKLKFNYDINYLMFVLNLA